jgi:7-carboxy-7-deazaguanine synthase
MMELTEIFYSLQGESDYTGLPCIFIRTAGCNLRCRYCDTQYSWENGVAAEIEQILQDIVIYAPVKLVEITGGEPLIQKDTINLITALRSKGYDILLETNGSILLDNVPDYVIKIVDIKTPGSGFENSFDMKNLEYIRLDRDEIKFVITSRQDYEWSKKFQKKYDLSGGKVLFSAAANMFAPQILAEWILEDKLPVRFQMQLQKYLWNNARAR